MNKLIISAETLFNKISLERTRTLEFNVSNIAMYRKHQRDDTKATTKTAKQAALDNYIGKLTDLFDRISKNVKIKSNPIDYNVRVRFKKSIRAYVSYAIFLANHINAKGITEDKLKKLIEAGPCSYFSHISDDLKDHAARQISTDYHTFPLDAFNPYARNHWQFVIEISKSIALFIPSIAILTAVTKIMEACDYISKRYLKSSNLAADSLLVASVVLSSFGIFIGFFYCFHAINSITEDINEYKPPKAI